MGGFLELTDEDRRELRRNEPFINDVATLITALPVVAVFAAIARSGMNSGDVDTLIDLLNMISHEYWSSVEDDEEDGIEAVMNELMEASHAE